MYPLPLPLAARYAVRALLLWAGVRACFVLVLLVGGHGEAAVASLRAHGPLGPMFVALTGALALVDLSRSRERAFLGNLGVSPRAMSALYLIAATAGEIARFALAEAW